MPTSNIPLPPELHNRLIQQFGTGTVQAVYKALSAKRLPTFRVNTLKTTDEVVMSTLRNEQIMFERIKTIPHAFMIKNRSDEELLNNALATEGKIYLQGIASMLPPLVLDPKPGETVLDLCAAPGSKTSQIAALMENRGTLMACEDNDIRVQKLRNTVRMQGADMVDVRHIDATLLHKELPEHFDKILADVPCSAEGRIELKDKRSFSYWSEKNIVAHAKLQRRLLRSAVGCLKPGGTLVYSTCTLAPEENEQMIAWLLQEFPNMKPVAFDLPVANTRKTSPAGILVLPTEQTEGFFVAKLKKNAASV